MVFRGIKKSQLDVGGLDERKTDDGWVNRKDKKNHKTMDKETTAACSQVEGWEGKKERKKEI